MNYYSTNKNSELVSFKEATIRGQAPDKGLYFPEVIPKIEKSLIDNIERLSNEEIAFRVIKPYVDKEINDDDLSTIVKETVNFPIPLVRINDRIYSLELFHGPTLAFKDVGARFMSRCLGYFLKNEETKVTVLVATSGDTGGAVANGFYNVPGIDVVILYPSGKVSPVQEKQLTTLGKNITALEVEGTFDDCQQMVKQAFADSDINQILFLTSANSINVARWLPQQFYYFFAYKQWMDRTNPPVVCVPSGNFGNICAGILAKQSGLPIDHFIAACNVNDVVTEYLQTSIPIATGIKPRVAIPTLSNAMDVGNPSNFIRILEIFHHRFPELKNNLSSFRVTDGETLTTIKRIFEKYDYTLDPHGAVGCLALEKYLQIHPNKKGIFLETAHPVKFPEAVENATGKKVDIPSSILSIMKSEKKSIKMPASYELFKNFLLD
ncbi:MAG TPA: threonine synthase [Chitinophagaceae bacterium]|nr:threonine synthase [Chitinophagaceae bacterium]